MSILLPSHSVNDASQTMNNSNIENYISTRTANITWLSLFVVFILLLLTFRDGVAPMMKWWLNREEYSHGILIPLISLYLIWLKKNDILGNQHHDTWWAVALVCLGLFLNLLGELSSLQVVMQYGFLISIYGLIFALVGSNGAKKIIGPMLLLVFMIPLPNYIYANLSSELQLISSILGVAFIKLFQISVYLEGNVIDLGDYKLQVVEACNGLRYLFPLSSLAFICAYIYKGTFIQKLTIFLSSLPITIAMNSVRIGIIGVLVEYWGIAAADGFLHSFEGWVIFMLCIGILIAEMWLITKLRKGGGRFADVFQLGNESNALVVSDSDLQTQYNTPRKSLLIILVIMTIATPASFLITQRQEIVPPRIEFSRFPEQIDEWRGKREHISQNIIDVLKLDDYTIINFSKHLSPVTNLYMAYYGSQRAGASAHSPKSCIPGDGWRIENHTIENLSFEKNSERIFNVNRVEIAKGDNRQLVYYWFQQRGRIITNEYLVKWFLFWDALTINRTDGALVRISTMVANNENIENAESRIIDFIQVLDGRLDGYIPGKGLS